MKKLLLFNLILLGMNHSGNAQKISVLLSAGGSYANTYIKTDTSKTESLGAKNGYIAGVSINIPINKHFSFQPGMNYLQKGFKNEAANTILTLNYIEIPLNMMFNTHNKNMDGKRADDFFFGIGPSIAFGVSGESKYNTGSGLTKEKINFGTSMNDDFKGVDVGANVQIGCLFVSNVFFSLNYTIGINSIGEFKDVVWRNRCLGFKLGYSFGGSKK